MRIEDGAQESHPTPLAYNPSQSPALPPPTEVVPGQLAGPTVDARDTVSEYQEPLAAAEADIRAAQASGMSAETDRRSHYAASGRRSSRGPAPASWPRCGDPVRDDRK